MKKIIYYVAASIDGFISGPNDDISDFIPDGNGVDQYLADLQDFKTVIMGRKTYEFGYKYGLEPGQTAYPHMEHYIFSNSLDFNEKSEKVHVMDLSIESIMRIKNSSDTDIYLCGGGEFAGWLLDHGLIDQLKLKLNPIILADGVRLFGNSKSKPRLNLKDVQTFEKGLNILTYDIEY